MSNTTITFPNHNKFRQRVIRWNTLAGNPPESASVDKQIEYTISEIEETIEAILNHDLKEVIDGICDVFVTLSYYNVINKFGVKGEMEASQLLMPKSFHELCYQLVTIMNYLLHNMDASFDEEHLMISAVSCLRRTFNVNDSINKLEEFLTEVLDSNDSKFVPYDQWESNSDAHDKFVNEKYSQKFGGIIPIIVKDENGDKFIVYRANEGDGKILKPMTFKEPQFNLEGVSL